MDNQPDKDGPITNPLYLSGAVAEIAERSQRLVMDFLSRQAREGAGLQDPLNVGQAFFQMTARLMTEPAKLMQANLSLWQDYMNLWQSTAQRMMGQDPDPVIEPASDDRRFRDEAWTENNVYDFIKQSYLLTSRWLQSTVAEVDSLDAKKAQKVDFFTRQFVDAISPTNFVLTNPQVLRATVESRGKNLFNGLQNLLDDLERGGGRLDIKTTDYKAFAVGGNVATTPGKVIFRNDLMELIQYAPATPKVARTPLLIVPPWINKFYILDLREQNSFIKWAVDQGHTTFVVSWVNPDAELAQKTFDDYMVAGPLAALDAIEAATGEARVNAVGYCIGGTLLACTLAYLAATRGQDRIASATFFTTMVDFAEAGELGVFIDEDSVESMEERMNARGYLEGREMATTFNMMRGNDLIWSFVVNNYLLGKEPFPFDLLYWNSDSTRMPAAMHGFYLRAMYLDNRLKDPGGITLAGVPLDLRRIEVPCYLVATREDHIAPWKSTYAATQVYAGPKRFVLSASGHIAGIINPPAAGKYCYWTNERLPVDAEAWLEAATQQDGSWWSDWQAWVKPHAGKLTIKARTPGGGKLKPLGDAPGSYVKMQTPG